MADLRARIAGATTPLPGPGGAPGPSDAPPLRERLWQRSLPLLRYLRRNPALAFGVAIFAGIMLFVGFGYLLYDVQNYEPLSVEANRSPSFEYPLGTDRLGRDILSAVIAGTPLTLRIGLIAGMVELDCSRLETQVSGSKKESPRARIDNLASVKRLDREEDGGEGKRRNQQVKASVPIRHFPLLLRRG